VIDRHTLFGPTSQLARIPRRIGRILHAQAARRQRSVDRRHAPRILAAIASVRSDAATWAVQDSRVGEPTILIVGPRGARPVAIIRVARSPSGQAGLERAAAALDQLHVRLAGLELRELLPVPIAHGALPGRTWLAETALEGQSARSLLPDPERRRPMLVATAQAIGAIHAATARPVAVDDSVLDRWVTRRVRIVAESLRRGPAASRASAERALASVASTIAVDLRDRTVSAGWIHGDLWPANVLVTSAGAVVAGIVDWDSAEDDELALHDRLHLAVTTRRLLERRALGPVIVGLLSGGSWTEDDRAVLDAQPGGAAGPDADPGDGLSSLSGLPDRTALWLYWLRVVESNLARHPRLAADRTWLTANVEQVLACA
jgi:hypothetical protein